MTTEEMLTTLRAATESDVVRALTDALVALPLTKPVDALEFFNRMLDVLVGELPDD